MAAALVLAAVLVAAVWLWPEPGPGRLPGTDSAAKQVAADSNVAGKPGLKPIGEAVAGGEVPQDVKPEVDPELIRLQGEATSYLGRFVPDSREDPTFTHLEIGRDVPDDIAAETNMSAAERTIVANELRDEDGRLAGALRGFATHLKDFKPTKDEQQVATGYKWMQMVTGHQELFLEMAPFFQNMDDDIQRRFYEERRPWTEFFKEDSLTIKLAKTVHAVRAETYRKMAAKGVDSDTLDKMRARYLLPGHFRYAGNDRFEFGPQLESDPKIPAPAKGK